MAYISSSSDRFRDRSKSEVYPPRGQASWGNEPSSAYASRGLHYDSIAENAPELYVAETATHIDPQLNEDAPTEDALLRRYMLEDGQLYQLAGNGQVCTSRDTGAQVVVKRVPKAETDAYFVARREVFILSSVSDTTIPSLVEWFELDNAIWSVVQHSPSRTVGQIVRSQVVSLPFLAGFAHLRICDETVYLNDKSQLTISDFQYACEYGKERMDDLYAATSEKHAADIYVAPEVFANKTYNARKAVIWSCGVLLYFISTGQTEKLSNLNHPSFEGFTPTPSTPEPTSTSSTKRKMSVSMSQVRVVHFPNRYSAPTFARQIIPKMLVENPRRRAELIECASRVPKDFSSKEARPLMEVSWLDYKHHVGPYAGLHEPAENESSASSIYSAVSKMSNPFGSLLGRASSRRKSAPVYTGLV